MSTKTTYVPVRGNSYPVKEKLKALGARWNGDEKCWMVPESKLAAAHALVGLSAGRAAADYSCFRPTGEQGALLSFLQAGSRNLFIEAGAGCGKTTTALWLLSHLRGRKCMVAFNTDIKQDIASKAPEGVEVLTMNALGFRALTSAYGARNAKVDSDYTFQIFKQIYGEDAVREDFRFYAGVSKLYDLARGALATESEDLEILASDHELSFVNEDTGADRLAAAIALTLSVMSDRASGTMMPEGLDFTDQMWLPVVRGLTMPKFDVLVIDEAQDTNALQVEMLARCADKGSRVIAVGDRRQCVSVETPVRTPTGTKRAGDLKAGDVVVAYRNGKNVEQALNHVLPSTWTRGIKIVTTSGRTLTMSPDHQIWASSPNMVGDKVLNYLMYRPGFGFRIGITNKCEDSVNPYGNRVGTERAERLWVLRVNEERDDALFWEEYFSLKYAIPTMVFEAEHRGLSVKKCERLFAEFGDNGRKLLADLDLSFDHPNWFAYSATGTKTVRRTVHLVAHAAKGSHVSFEWSGLDLDAALDAAGAPYIKEANNRRRMRRFFSNYREALAFGEMVAKAAKANFRERLSTAGEPISLLTASALIPTMRVAVHSDDGIRLEEIARVEPVVEASFVDLDVGDASNFYGDDILSHNCIYRFRGADSRAVDAIVERFDMAVMPLMTTFRCGKAIVAEAQRIVPQFQAGEHNPEGIVRTISIEALSSQARPGDFVISRTNAPLIAGCIATLASGVRATVVGRDIGEDLLKLAKKFRAKTMEEFYNRLEAWKLQQIEKLSRRVPVREAAIEAVEDKVACLEALASDCTRVESLYTRCETLFTDASSEPRIEFTSTHKAKGRERNRVFLLSDTFCRARKDRKTGEWMEPSEEEFNLLYVAITRAKSELVYVEGETGRKGRR